MARMAQWVMGGTRPGLVVIDSCESAGLPTDSNNAAPWYEKYVNPSLNAGAGVLLLDHVPKRKEDRPKGPIGSQYKRVRLTGAGLFMAGTAWTKTEGGTLSLYNHKDRLGDLPAPVPKKVAVIKVVHQEGGGLAYTIEPPGKDDGVDVTDGLLYEIAKLGADGVTGSKKVRALVKAKGKDVDEARDELLQMGLIGRTPAGKAWLYFATAEGIEAVEHGEV